MVFICRPVGVKLVTQFPVLLFLICFQYKGVGKKLRPGQTLAGSLVEEALEEGLELGAHVVWELDGVFDNQVNQRVDTVSVKWWGSYEELVDNNS
jgi:hypothetical protein